MYTNVYYIYTYIFTSLSLSLSLFGAEHYEHEYSWSLCSQYSCWEHSHPTMAHLFWKPSVKNHFFNHLGKCNKEFWSKWFPRRVKHNCVVWSLWLCVWLLGTWPLGRPFSEGWKFVLPVTCAARVGFSLAWMLITNFTHSLSPGFWSKVEESIFEVFFLNPAISRRFFLYVESWPKKQ